MNVSVFKDALLKKRTEILGTGGIKPLQASMENNTPPGRHGRSGQRQQRSPHPAEAEADRREDPAGHRRGAAADRQGHLRHLPRLRRADRRGAAQRDSVDARLHHLQGKTELRDTHDAAPAPAGILPREAGAAAAAPGRARARRPVRRQQHLPVHHQPRRDAAVVAAARAHGPRRALPTSRRRRPGTPTGKGEGRGAGQLVAEDARDSAAPSSTLAAAWSST